MRAFRIHSTTGNGNEAQNVSLKLRAKDEAEAKRIAREYLEARGHKVVTQWRGIA